MEIIKHAGRVTKFTRADGKVIERQDQLLVPEWEKFISQVPDDDHFIYPNDVIDQSAYMCTCGSVGVVAPPDPNRGWFICHFFLTYGYHQTGVVNKDGFSDLAGSLGGNPHQQKGRKWLI